MTSTELLLSILAFVQLVRIWQLELTVFAFMLRVETFRYMNNLDDMTISILSKELNQLYALVSRMDEERSGLLNRNVMMEKELRAYRDRKSKLVVDGLAPRIEIDIIEPKKARKKK